MKKKNIDKEKRQIAILGSTGSIGTQTLDVISQHPEIFEVELLTANENVQKLSEQAIRFNAKDVVICNPDKYGELKSALAGHDIGVHAGMDAVCELVVGKHIGTVVASMVGFSGLRSTVAALKAGKTVALANKETLVAAGAVVEDLVHSGKSSVIPVDSEHSAIFQCLQGNLGEKMVKLHLTASGGPFRTWERGRIAAAKATDALKHPNWSMGAKVTIDSATMMNKGLEVIEAKWLFDMEPANINVVVHPQSIIHSMVEYEDGAVIAQLGCPDMREPIQYALAYPHRLPLNNRKLDFTAVGSLDFAAPDFEKFPCLGLAFKAIERGGTATVAMNAANEIAVKAYLEDRIGFYDIADLIASTMDKATFKTSPTLDEIYSANEEALAIARSLLH